MGWAGEKEIALHSAFCHVERRLRQKDQNAVAGLTGDIACRSSLLRPAQQPSNAFFEARIRVTRGRAAEQHGVGGGAAREIGLPIYRGFAGSEGY